MTSIELIVYLSIILAPVGGFLLDGNTHNGQHQYLTLSEFYDNKNQQQHDTAELRHETEEIRHKMEQLKDDNAKTLALLTSQLQQRFSDIQKNITAASQYNETVRLGELWELKYRELQKNNTKLQIRFNDLEVKYTALNNEMILRPTTHEIDIEQAKIHNASKELFSMAAKERLFLKNKTTVLENKMDVMAIHEIHNLHSVQNQIQEVSTKTDSKIETVENTLRERLAFENCSCFANTSERVTFTACVEPSFPFNTEIIRFNSIKVQIGIESLRYHGHFGTFICEKSGLYLVNVSVVSNAFGSLFSIRKNGFTVVQSVVSMDNKSKSASLAAAVSLNVHDDIDIYADNNVDSLALGSCVTVVKIS